MFDRLFVEFAAATESEDRRVVKISQRLANS